MESKLITPMSGAPYYSRDGKMPEFLREVLPSWANILPLGALDGTVRLQEIIWSKTQRVEHSKSHIWGISHIPQTSLQPLVPLFSQKERDPLGSARLSTVLSSWGSLNTCKTSLMSVMLALKMLSQKRWLKLFWQGLAGVSETLCTQGPKRLKASQDLGTDSWCRESTEALLKSGVLCCFYSRRGCGPGGCCHCLNCTAVLENLQ